MIVRVTHSQRGAECQPGRRNFLTPALAFQTRYPGGCALVEAPLDYSDIWYLRITHNPTFLRLSPSPTISRLFWQTAFDLPPSGDRQRFLKMSPAVTRPRALIPVFLTVKLNPEVRRLDFEFDRSSLLIDFQVLNSFLEQALAGVDDSHRRLCVVTNVTDASFRAELSKPPVEVIESPFIGFAERQLREAILSQKGLTDAAFIMLDEQTRKDSCTCRLVSRKQAHFFSVRSDFRGAQRSLDAVLDESTNIQRLRNEAAMSGGVLRNDRARITHVANGQNAVSFLNKPTTSKTWETCCKPGCGHQNKALIPVFCTAELPLKVSSTTPNPRHWEGLIDSKFVRH